MWRVYRCDPIEPEAPARDSAKPSLALRAQRFQFACEKCMIECPFCYRVFRQPPEKIGARCPKCRMPLYEDPSKKKKDPEKDYGKCAQHPDAPTVAKCSRCDAPVCRSCRTRWHQEVVCP